jgi:alkanesulfonate monooxygenase SsuD/methylene tetrahydromethanopterin reductase-like flavin-dependent oxidoreductase (luciferase family)
MVVAHHIRPGRTEAALEHYRRQFRPSRWLDRPRVMVSVTVIGAGTSERAEALARPYEVLIAQALTGQKAPLYGMEQAAAYPFTPREQQLITSVREGEVRGDAGQIEQGLTALADRFAPDELIVTVPVYEIDDRLRTLEIVAGKG